MHIPLRHLQKRLDEIPGDRDIIVGCRSGRRSFLALKLIRRAGFQKTSGMKDGIAAWEAAGYPISKESEPE